MYALGAVRDTLVEVVQVIEKDEPDVQPGHAEEEGEGQHSEPDTVALQRGKREVVAIHTSGSESPTAGSSRGFLPGIGLLCRQLFPYLRELCFLGRESTPPTASAHTWPLSPLPSGLCLGLPAPHPLSTLLVRILSLGNFLQWQLYRQWKQRAQAEQQRGDSAMVRAWGK